VFDAPADVPPLLVALSLVSATLVGVAVAASPDPAPRADPLADTIEAVAAADAASAETIRVRADAVRITDRALAVRADDQTARATFAYGPVVPVRADTRLWRVLHGTNPRAVFDRPLGLRNAATAAALLPANWRRNPAELTVRRVTWRGVDVTLVGA
jgi:hypothetical protein